MGLDNFFNSLDVSASGLRAERARMDMVAQNIANANVTRTAEGGPYRRREILFESIMKNGRTGQGGVEISGVVEDMSPFIKIKDPGHPDADSNGMVLMPNVKMPFEMVDMITAARAYEANLNMVKSFRDMVERALSIGR